MSKPKKKAGEQFYLKFTYNDVLSSTSLRECSAVGAGVYFFIFCLLCKTNPRGRYEIKPAYMGDLLDILPRQNVQQSNRQVARQIKNICRNFAGQFVKHLPYPESVIAEGLEELLENDVLYVEANFLCQKRLIRDSEISAKRSIAGGKGAAATNKKNTGVSDPLAAPLPTDLPTILPQQKHQQSVYYNYNSNYNSNSLGEEGVSNNMGGGTGEENSGGEEGIQKISDYEGNWGFLIPVAFCKHFFFNHQAFANLKDGAMRVLSNFYRVDGDMPNDQRMGLLTDRLLLWADEFNDFLDRTEPKHGSNPIPLKMMQGRDGWQNHFHNWLLTQKDRLSNLPNKRIDNQPTTSSNGASTLISGDASIQAQEDFYKRKKNT